MADWASFEIQSPATQRARMYHKAKHVDTRIYRVRELSLGNNPGVKQKIAGADQPSDIGAWVRSLHARRLHELKLPYAKPMRSLDGRVLQQKPHGRGAHATHEYT